MSFVPHVARALQRISRCIPRPNRAYHTRTMTAQTPTVESRQPPAPVAYCFAGSATDSLLANGPGACRAQTSAPSVRMLADRLVLTLFHRPLGTTCRLCSHCLASRPLSLSGLTPALTVWPHSRPHRATLLRPPARRPLLALAARGVLSFTE